MNRQLAGAGIGGLQSLRSAAQQTNAPTPSSGGLLQETEILHRIIAEQTSVIQAFTGKAETILWRGGSGESIQTGICADTPTTGSVAVDGVATARRMVEHNTAALHCLIERLAV